MTDENEWKYLGYLHIGKFGKKDLESKEVKIWLPNYPLGPEFKITGLDQETEWTEVGKALHDKIILNYATCEGPECVDKGFDSYERIFREGPVKKCSCINEDSNVNNFFEINTEDPIWKKFVQELGEKERVYRFNIEKINPKDIQGLPGSDEKVIITANHFPEPWEYIRWTTYGSHIRKKLEDSGETVSSWLTPEFGSQTYTWILGAKKLKDIGESLPQCDVVDIGRKSIVVDKKIGLELEELMPECLEKLQSYSDKIKSVVVVGSTYNFDKARISKVFSKLYKIPANQCEVARIEGGYAATLPAKPVIGTYIDPLKANCELLV